MRKKYFLLLIPFLSMAMHAQTFSCAVPHETHDKELQRVERLSALKRSGALRKTAAGEITYVPIKMQLFGRDNGTGYATQDDVNDALAQLNKKFKPVGVEFYFSGTTFNYYANSLFYEGNMTGQQDDNFRAANGVRNAINLYVAETVKVGTTGVGGYTFITPTTQFYNRIWVYLRGLNDDKTTPHEMGHYFGLAHTFNNSDSNDLTERELVIRNFNEVPPRLPANCDVEGDYVCDTPADAFNVPNVSVTDCVYTGTAKDRNGDTFAPSLSNIMNYYFCGPYDFTRGQEERMAEGTLIVTNATDFTLDAPETAQNAPSNITVSNGNDIYVGNTVITWRDNSSNETGYIIEAATAAQGPFVAVGGVRANATSFNYADAIPNTTYYFRVKPSNSKAIYSAISAVITTPILCGNSQGRTCNGNPERGDWRIEEFKLSKKGVELFNNTNSGCSDTGITNYFNTYSAQVAPGDVIHFHMKSKYGTDGGYNFFVALYADWNMDNDFDDDGEMLYNTPQKVFSETGSSFTVPQLKITGDIRLRIMLSRDSQVISACNVNQGEIEDYKLVNTVLGFAGSNIENVTVYPNPVTSLLNIQIPDALIINGIEVIEVMDVTGKKVISQTGADKQISVQSLAAGMYIVQITSGNQKFVQKFIKQ
jgi:hypothetical protein